MANQIALLIADTFADGFIDFYAGDPNAGGTLLAECKLPIAPFTASNGVLTLAGQWFGTTSTAGEATYAKIRDFANQNFLVVTVGVANAQIVLSNTTLIFGDVISITSFSYTIPTS